MKQRRNRFAKLLERNRFSPIKDAAAVTALFATTTTMVAAIIVQATSLM